MIKKTGLSFGRSFLISSSAVFLAAACLIDARFFFSDFSSYRFHTWSVNIPFFLRFCDRNVSCFYLDRRSFISKFITQALFKKFQPARMDIVFFSMDGDEKRGRRMSDLSRIINARRFWSVALERAFGFDAGF